MAYKEIDPQDMILRDHLARDRTVLANERTLLAYIRTAIALLAAGGTLLKLFWGNTAIAVLGGFLLAFGATTIAVGVWRFRVVARDLCRLSRDEGGPLPNER